MAVRAIIADDEPLARQRLRDLIAPVDWLRCVAETPDGPSTVQAIDSFKPDLVFLDVRMPGASGLDVLNQVVYTPHVIFTTAYDRYAVTAFELQAVDYLLKPFGEERFMRAIERVRDLAESDREGATVGQRAASAWDREQPLSRLFVRVRGMILPILVDDIVRLEAQGDFVMIHSADGSHLVNVALKEILDLLDSERFVRIHRSHAVNLDCVLAFRKYDGHRLLVQLTGGAEIVASKTGTKLLRRLVV